MSPYLLAFMISDFDYSSIKNGRVNHRIYARSDNEAYLKTQLALRTSDLFLKELERYISFQYEMDKLDQVALPDFQSGLFICFSFKKFLISFLFYLFIFSFSLAGAMENWGLITYKYVNVSLGIFHDECRT